MHLENIQAEWRGPPPQLLSKFQTENWGGGINPPTDLQISQLNIKGGDGLLPPLLFEGRSLEGGDHNVLFLLLKPLKFLKFTLYFKRLKFMYSLKRISAELLQVKISISCFVSNSNSNLKSKR